jgi:hypothetical protein
VAAVTTRGTLLSVGAILWVAAAGCWLRARGSWRLSREGWLFLVLGLPFFVAGLFYSTSSYPLEGPLPVPNAPATPLPGSPVPARPTRNAPLTYAEAVTEAQYAAVARYPELGKSGTLFNARFIAAYRKLRVEDPGYFTDPGWPVRLADEIAHDSPPRP